MSWWSDDAIASLASLPGFPPLAERAARDLLSRTLESIVTAGAENLPDLDEHAAALVHEIVAKMMEYDKWPGPAHFFQVARRLRFGDGSQYESSAIPHLSQYLPAPATATDCERCSDFGYRVVAGTYERCECPAGRALGQPFLDMLNGRREPRKLAAVTMRDFVRPAPLEMPAPITRADVDDAVHVRRIPEALALDAQEQLEGGTIHA